MQGQIKGLHTDYDMSARKGSTMESVFQTSPALEEKMQGLTQKIGELSSKVSLEQKSLGAKVDVVCMDIQSLRNFEKQSRAQANETSLRLEALEALRRKSQKPKKSIPLSDIYVPEKSDK
jgi:outer membrane murein-binding lipoprotein Lpp